MSAPKMTYEELEAAARVRIRARSTATESGCWEWQGDKNEKGYGRVGAFGLRSMFAHRVSYAVFVDPQPLPDGYSIDHLCRNRGCVNPDHLEAVPHLENIRRGKCGVNWSSRTHCKNGHEYTLENTGRYRGVPGRRCRACNRERQRRYAAQRRAEK